MKSLTLSFALSAILSSIVPATHAQTESWPNKPIKIVVPFGAGSFTDTAARTIGAEISKELGQPVIVENKGGAGSTLGTDQVAKAAPDGYTFLLTDNSFAVSAALYNSLPYQPDKDIIQVSLVADAPAVLVGRPKLPANTLKEVVDLAKKEPGKLTFGSGGQGSSAHLAMESFLLQNKLSLNHIPFKGIAPALVDVAADRVDIAIGSVGTTGAYIKDGRLKGLAVSGNQRHPMFPDVPTFAQAGYPDYKMMYLFGVMAPAGTPKPIVEKMQAAITKAIATEKVQSVFSAAGVQAKATTPAQYAKLVQDEINQWRNVIKQANVKIN